MAPMLLPLPKKMKLRPGRLDLSGDAPLFLSPEASERELAAALSLVGEARSRCGARLPLEKSFSPDVSGRCVRLALFGRDARLVPELRGLPHPKELGEEGYVIDVSPQRALVAANAPAGLFWAAQTLRQMLEVRGGRAGLPCCRVVDWPDFRYRGVMLDVSRFKVPRQEYLLALAETLSALKLNVLQLYVEHPFAWRRHPAAGRGISPLTAEEILELDRRCRELGVELQANLQSFGHQRHLLTRAGYARYAEVPPGWPVELDAATRKRYPWVTPGRIESWSLSPAAKGTYQLIGELYDEVLPLFESPLFNADCDETWDLGFGRSAAQCRRHGKARVYLGHILKLHKLARERGKRMMMWGDIVLDHPELIGRLPKDMLVLDWAYDAQGDRNRTCRQFAKAGLEFWVCPGVGSWGSVFPRVEVAAENIRKFAEAGRRHGATGLLNTDWGDDGHFQPLGGSLHGYAAGAEQSWTAGRAGYEGFDRRFAWAAFRDESGRFGRLFRELGRTNAPFGKDRPLDYASYPFLMLWDRPARPRPRESSPKWRPITKGQLRQCEAHARRALELAAELRREFPERRTVIEQCAEAARNTLLACRRERVFDKAAAALAGKRRLSAGERKQVAAVRADWRRSMREFQRLWLADSRRSQIGYRLGMYRKRDGEYARLLKQSNRGS